MSYMVVMSGLPRQMTHTAGTGSRSAERTAITDAVEHAGLHVFTRLVPLASSSGAWASATSAAVGEDRVVTVAGAEFAFAGFGISKAVRGRR